ncbi:MAG: ABC transporter substrate-binding protein [Caulobacteraceae bacterium]
MRSIRSLIILATMALVAGLAPVTALAAAADPAAMRVNSFDASLLETMKAGPSLGAQGRFRRLAPVVERDFDIPVMTRFAVGPAWAKMGETDHRALIEAFTRLTAASYAHNFDRWSGERFTIDPKVEERAGDKIVRSQIVPTRGAPTDLIYRMRQDAGAWKIIDVYFGAISQLTTRRSDFAAPLASGGAAGLKKHLDAAVARLLK